MVLISLQQDSTIIFNLKIKTVKPPVKVQFMCVSVNQAGQSNQPLSCFISSDGVTCCAAVKYIERDGGLRCSSLQTSTDIKAPFIRWNGEWRSNRSPQSRCKTDLSTEYFSKWKGWCREPVRVQIHYSCFQLKTMKLKTKMNECIFSSVIQEAHLNIMVKVSWWIYAFVH